MKLEGELREISLIPKLIELSDDRFTGAIRFENEDESIIKIVYFKEGNVLSASTNDRNDSIDEILLRSSKVSREHIKQALAKRKDNETLGDALLGLGFITRKELAWVRRVQLIGIVRSLERWESGTYTVVADYLPKREEGTLFNLLQIIVEVLVTEQDRTRVEAGLGGSEMVFELAPDGETRYRSLGLNEDADRIFAAVDGTSSADQIASTGQMDAFATFKLLYAFRLLGVIRPSSKPQVKDEVLSSAHFPDFPGIEERPTGELLLTTPEPVTDHDDWDDQKRADPIRKPVVRSSSPSLSMPEPKRSPFPLMLLALLILAGAGYAAYRYWPRPGKAVVFKPTAAKKPSPAAPARAVATAVITDSAALQQRAPTETSAPQTASSPMSTATSRSPVEPAAPRIAASRPSLPALVPVAPVAVASASTDPQRDNYERQGREFASSAKSVPYAYQVAFLCETSSLKNAIQAGGEQVWFLPSPRAGRTCFRVFWGKFPSKAAAQSANPGLPTAFRDVRPVLVHTSELVK